MKLLEGFELIQMASPEASELNVRAVEFAGLLASSCGATVFVPQGFPNHSGDFFNRDKQSTSIPCDTQSVLDWATAEDRRLVLSAVGPGFDKLLAQASVPTVQVQLETWHTETTLFADSGLSQLLGDPQREPLTPAGHFAMGPIGYSAFCAACALYMKLDRFGEVDHATIKGADTLSWVNWKAAAGGALGVELCRKGDALEWPILESKDGHIALVLGEADWGNLVPVVGDERLLATKFSTFSGREEHHAEWVAVIRDWVAGYTCAELDKMFDQCGVPAVSVVRVAEVFDDPMFVHRDAFKCRESDAGVTVKSMQAPYRVVETIRSVSPACERAASVVDHNAEGRLPMAGIRVLDLGIITAGAGTGAIVADLGAEVLKIESRSHPDPFRSWGGTAESPLFRFNNRNKFGIDIDLKSASGKESFLKLVETADVVTENFRRGVLERMGLGLDVLQARNPRIVLASISGQGADGPGALRASYGSSLEASSGFAALTSYADDTPTITGMNVNYPDQTICLYSAAMIIAAVHKANRSGSAIHIDISQRDTCSFIIGDVFERVSAGLSDDCQTIATALWNNDFDGAIKSMDERYVAVSVKKWQDLSGLKLKDITTLREWGKKHDAQAIESIMRESGVAAVVVKTGGELLESNLSRGSVAFVKSPQGHLVKGFPFQLENVPLSVFSDAPSIGEHNADFL
jgi:crotonobetainyl-CoA:carnitine CoA-transferase CaiB-like acyl-CoA transferase